MYDHEICMIEECSVTGDRIHQEYAPGMSCGKLVDDLAMPGDAFVHKINNSIRAFNCQAIFPHWAPQIVLYIAEGRVASLDCRCRDRQHQQNGEDGVNIRKALGSCDD